MKVLIRGIKSRSEKSAKYDTDQGVLNAANSKIKELEIGKTYEMDVNESEYQGHMMKWINKAVEVHGEPEQAQPQAGGGVAQPNAYQEHEKVKIKAMLMSYAKDIYLTQLTTAGEGEPPGFDTCLLKYSQMADAVFGVKKEDVNEEPIE